MISRLLLALFCLSLGPVAAAATAGTDELWEVTLNMDTGGMKALPGGMAMPAMTMKSCTAKGGYLDPKSVNRDNKDCTFFDTHASGNKVTYKFKCTGEAPMEGSGESTRTGNTMKGSQRSTYQGHEMVQNYEGRIVGTCNAADEKANSEKRMADSKAASAAMMAGLPSQRDMDAYQQKSCQENVDEAIKTGGSDGSKSVLQDSQLCPGKLPAVCSGARANANTYEGYTSYHQAVAYAKDSGGAYGWVVGACNIDLDKSQTIVCRKAISDKNYKFLGANCPTQVSALRQENCADFGWGLSGDTADKPNYAVCTALGPGSGASGKSKVGSGGTDPRAPAAAAADKSAVEKATDSIVDKAKSLKGLLGF